MSNGDNEITLSSDEMKVSYGFGLQFGDQLRRNDFEGLDLEAVFVGIRHWYDEQRSQLGDGELNPSYEAIKAKQDAAKAELNAKANAIAEQYLSTNAARDEVTVTDSGLQFEVLESGDGGDSPGAASTVVTHYHGTFIDGTVFDSSLDRGEPATFGVNQVIPGWTEVLQLMSPGDKYRITCPPHLAYGEQGAGGSIPPNTTLVFDIHLMAIQD